MGILDQLRSISDKVLNRNDPKAYRGPSGSGTRLPDAVGINVVALKLDDYFSHPDRREKIGQILTNLGRFAVDSAVSESLKGVTGGLQVYKIVKEGLKDQPSSHATNGPDLTLTMEQIQAQLEKMQEEMKRMKKQQYELSTCAKPESQLEKMHEDMNDTKQQIENLTCCASAKASDPLKELSTEPTEGSVPSKNDVKRVMIRSRL